MKTLKINFWIIAGLLISGMAFSKARVKEFSYEVDGQEYEGYIADGAPKGKKVPGILVVHEWWGQNDYPKNRAKMLADEGYVAFAVDMFGKGKVAEHPKKAKEFATKSMSDPEKAKKVFQHALRILKEQKSVDEDKIAAIGYCYGGGVVLTMASMGVDLDLVASFHGTLSKDFEIKKRKDNPRVMIFNGADDPMVTSEQLASVRKELNDAGVRNTIENYPGAKHGFTNPEATKNGKKFDIPLEYDKKADKDSWNELLKALKEL